MEQLIFDPDGDVFLMLCKPSETGSDTSNLGGLIQKDEPVQEDGLVDEDVPDYNIRMQVSSKHLILASSVFKSMLRGNFMEGQALRSKGSLELPLPDDNPDALTILLNIIHGHCRKVPRKMKFLNWMLDITILVDKYQLHDAVSVYSDSWIKILEPDIPNGFCEDSITWLSISWVFEKRELFKRTTQVVQRGSQGRIISDGLPIPPVIVDEIDQSKQAALVGVIDTLKQLIDKYRDEKNVCACQSNQFECNAMVLGSLIKGCVQLGLWPVDPQAYIGSFENLCRDVRAMKIPTLCNYQNTGYYNQYDSFYNDHRKNRACCDIKSILDNAITNIYSQLSGLHLVSFKR